jgi:hypothetical protein
MTPEGLQRRTLLRNLLAWGGLLCLPLVAGCGKKSPSPEASPMAGGEPPSAMPPGLAMQPSAPAAPAPAAGGSSAGKLAQAAVQYQDHAKGDESCSNCMHFNATNNTCELVADPISPTGWCTIWVKKA